MSSPNFRWYKAFFDDANVGMVVTDSSYKFIDVNPAFCQMLGYSREELLQKTVLEVTYKDDLKVSSEKLNKQFEGKISGFSIEKRYVTKEGEVVWGSVSSTATLSDSKESALLSFAVIQNITKQKLLEEELKVSESSYHSLIDQSPDGVAVHSDGKVIFVNRGAVQMLGGQKESDLIGRPTLSFVHPDSVKVVSERIGQMLKDNQPVPTLKEKFIKIDGSELEVEVSASPIFFQGKKAIQVVLHDISTQVMALEKLRLSEEKFRSLFENMLDGFAYCRMIYDEKGTPVDFEYLDVNQKFIDLTGLRDVVGKKVSEVIPDIQKTNSELFDIYGKAAKDGISNRFETYVQPLKIWFSVSVYSPAKDYFVAVFNNITERKNSEEAIKLSEERYRTLAEAANDMIFVIEKDGSISYVNSYAALQFGKQPGDFIGKPKSVFFGEEISQRQDKSLNEVFMTGKPIYRETQTPFGDKTVWLSTWLVPLKTKGEVGSILGVSRDISSAKEAEEKLIKERDFSEKLINSLPGIYYLIDDEGKFVRWNNNLVEVGGYSVSEIEKMKAFDFFEGDEKKLIEGKIKEVFGQGYAEVEGNLVTKNGRAIPYYFNGARLEVEGKILLSGMGVDITDRVRAVADLAEGRARLGAILEGIGEGVLVVDELGRVMLFNRMASKISGYESSEVISRNYWEILHFNPEGLAHSDSDFIRKALSSKQLAEVGGVTLSRKDGQKVSVSASAAPVFGINQSLIGVVVVFRDMTKQREVEKMRDEFMMIASHELRAPMTAIKWLVAMVLEGSYGPISENMKPSLENIASSTDRLIHLVNDMISVTRFEGRQIKHLISDFDIRAMIESLLLTFSSEAKKKMIHMEAVEVASLIVRSDSESLVRIVSNLIDNALKFTPEGGEITIKTEKQEDDLLLSVIDTGLGIAQENRDKVFTKFGQVFNQKEGKQQGTGLGLYISRELARSVGGDLILEKSEVGRGSTFVVKIPIKVPSSIEEREALSVQK